MYSISWYYMIRIYSISPMSPCTRYRNVLYIPMYNITTYGISRCVVYVHVQHIAMYSMSPCMVNNHVVYQWRWHNTVCLLERSMSLLQYIVYDMYLCATLLIKRAPVLQDQPQGNGNTCWYIVVFLRSRPKINLYIDFTNYRHKWNIQAVVESVTRIPVLTIK